MHVITQRPDMDTSPVDQISYRSSQHIKQDPLCSLELAMFLLAADQGAGLGATVKWRVRRQRPHTEGCPARRDQPSSPALVMILPTSP